jgi:hypothetical protein
VLHHEIDVLSPKSSGPRFWWADRAFFALSAPLSLVSWRSLLVTPATLLDWQRKRDQALDVPEPARSSSAPRRCTRAVLRAQP